MKAHFVLSKKKALMQYNTLKKLGIKISYSFKTNRDVGKLLGDLTNCEFSVHLREEIDMLKRKELIWFFSQAWNEKYISIILKKGIRNFVVDNENDLKMLIDFIKKHDIMINLLIRMKFQEHRVSSGKYFAHGMAANKVNSIINDLKNNPLVNKLGIHIHRKSQNTSEWSIKEELEDSLSEESLKRINIVNFGGGLPVRYKSYTSEGLPYIFEKIKEAKNWLKEKNIESYIEPGRFIAGPAVNLVTEIIQVYDNIIVVNTSLYNCAMDTHLTETKMIVENELEDNQKDDYYLIKGNSPTRDDIFRYKVKLKKPSVGDKLIFLNAGAYNYNTGFCGFKKLETKIID